MNFLIALFIALGPESVEGGIKFTYYDPSAKQVYLAGDFNNWSTTANPMKRAPDGTWWIVIKLPPGRYEYKFVVDGQWTRDPMNPVTAGIYGNSVIRVGEDGKLLPVLPTSNTPMSSLVYFNGKLKSFLNFEREAKTYRLYQTENDVKLDINVNLEERIKLFIRLKYNTLRDRNQYHVIPVSMERALATFTGNKFELKGFYNRWAFKAQDPLKLVGYEGEFHEPFGRKEQGILFSSKRFLDLYALYSNNYLNDRDLFFLRAQKKIKAFKIALNYLLRDGYDIMYSVPGPDSATSDSGNLIHYDLYKRDNFASFDASVNIGKNIIWFALGQGKLSIRSDYRDLYGTGVRKFHKDRWDIGKDTRVTGGVGLKDSLITLSYERETWKYDSLFVHQGKRRIAWSRWSIGTSKRGERIRGNLNITFTTMETDSFLPWERLWDYSWSSKAEYFEYLLFGYDQKLTLNAYLEAYLLTSPHLRWTEEVKIASYALKTPPRTFEIIEEVELIIPPLGFLLNHRTFHVKSSLFTNFPLNRTFMATYFEVYYRFSPRARVGVSYGLRPLDLNDEPRNRREFLEEQGITSSILENNYRMLGRLITKAEEALSSYNRISIHAEVSF